MRPMRRSYGSVHLYVTSGAYYVRWRTPGGHYLNRSVGAVRTRDRGTQAGDGYSQVKAMVQLKYNPKWVFLSNGPNSPAEFPSKVGPKNVNGVFSGGDWFPQFTSFGNAAFVKAYLKALKGSSQDARDGNVQWGYSDVMLFYTAAKRIGFAKFNSATDNPNVTSANVDEILYGSPDGAR